MMRTSDDSLRYEMKHLGENPTTAAVQDRIDTLTTQADNLAAANRRPVATRR